MTRLSDTQLVILSAAAQRDDLSVLPLPDSVTVKGGAVDKVLGSLKAKGLIDHQGAPRGDDPPPLSITRAGLQAIGIEGEEPGSDTAPAKADMGTMSASAGVQATDTGRVTEAAGSATPAKKGKAAKGKARGSKTAPAEKPTPRAGTKQALMIELLKRPEGATVEQIAAATSWQHHTVRGAISGALKKKLGLPVEAIRVRQVGPNQPGAKGSTTVYRITGSSLAAD
jgi:hypothetical protein